MKGLILVLLVWALELPALGQAPVPFHGSEAFYDFRKGGHELVDERSLDIDGDGLADALVVEQSAEGLGLSLWKAEPAGGFRFLWRSDKVQASSLAEFKQISLGKSGVAFLLDVYEDSPDEVDHWVRLFSLGKGALQKIFESRYRVAHSEEDAGRAPVKVVDLGGLEVGLQVAPSKEGWPRLVVRHDPKRILLRGRGGQEIAYVIGMKEREYVPEGQGYREASDGYLDFLPRVPVCEVTSTSVLPSSNGENDPAKAADGNLDTGWVEGQAGPGTGESVTLVLSRPAEVRMIRVVPGCSCNEDSWNRRNRLKRFSLQLEGGIVVKVNREGIGEIDPALEAWEDFSLPGRAFGTQTMLFFAPKVKTAWVKLTIEDVESGTGTENETCLGEISVHEERAGASP